MTRKNKQIITFIMQYIHDKYDEQLKLDGRKAGQKTALEVCSALIEQYRFHDSYSSSTRDVAKVIQCDKSTHTARLKRFVEKCGNLNYKSKAVRIMEQCANEIERLYGVRRPVGESASIHSSRSSKASSANDEEDGYTDFMATLQSLE